jgi:hypothetical protein
MVAPLKVIQSSRNLTGHAGLAAVGHCLNSFAQLSAAVDPKLPVRAGMSNSDIVRAYVGLLALGKSDFEAIENFRQDAFFRRAMGLQAVPSSATLRQRLDEIGPALQPLTDELCVPLLKRAKASVTALSMGHVALDMDVFGMDNSGTRKEGVSRTYAGYDGYAPIAAYLGTEGWCLALELREGRHHSAKETHYTLERTLPRAQALTDAPILVRMDSGFDSHRLIGAVLGAGATRVAQGGAAIDVLVKWNPRANGKAKVVAAAQAMAKEDFIQAREGKRLVIWKETITRKVGKRAYTLTRVYRAVERTIDRHGQHLLLPEWTIDGWETSLDVKPEQVIALYADHGTHEQFHSEFKTDMDLERLPSGKFDTNDTVLSLAAVAYNCLRLIGQNALLGPDAPVRHPAKRRRLRTVIEELMYLAANVVNHARSRYLDLGAHSPAFNAFKRLVESWRIRIA